MRNLITHLLVMTTQQRPAMECRAINSDSKSLAQAYLGNGILEYFLREKKIERNLKDAVECALVMGEGYIRLDWDARAGKEYGATPDMDPTYAGDVRADNFTAFDVIKDVTRSSSSNPDWYVLHSQRNKYDLAAKHPQLAEQILSVSSKTESGSSKFRNPSKLVAQAGFGKQETDDVSFFEFYHRVSDALPQGRYTIFLDADITLYDGPLPFREIPVYRVSASDIIGCPFGWTVAFDLLGLQTLIDKLYSVVATNQLASGVQTFWQETGNQLTPINIAGGLNLLESASKPEVLELLHTPAEVFNFIRQLEGACETLSGINSVARGQPEASLKSGSALALVASQAVQFNSGLQNSYNQLLEGVGTGLIQILTDFATTPRMAVIAGSFNRPLMKSFVGKGLEKINRVVVDAASAMSRTTAGKIQIAQDLLQSGLIKTTQEYFSVVATGKLEALYEGEMSEILNVRSENEEMRSGNTVRALYIDDHQLHILEHRALLANPQSRSDGPLCERVLAHIQEHIDELQGMQANNPALMAILGRPQVPGPAQPGSGATPATVNATPPAAMQAQNVRKPNMPSLPPGSPPEAQQAYEQIPSAV